MNIKKYTYQIDLLTGLHIGGFKEGLQIGGIDNPVIKHPHTNQPYIPGSSLKGRMRGLLELKYNVGDISQCDTNYEKQTFTSISQNAKEVIARAFGCASKDIKLTSRLLFSDFHLVKNDSIARYFLTNDKLSNDFYEDKTEVTVPRNLNKNPNPRHQERVPAGVSFMGTITFVDSDDRFPISHELLEAVVQEGIDLIQNMYLGGGGTRGNGRVDIKKQSQ